MILVAVQIIMGSGDWGRGLLWASFLAVASGSFSSEWNLFHSFSIKNNQVDKAKDQSRGIIW